MTESHPEVAQKAIENFLQASSQGNIANFIETVKSVPHVDVSNERGWTALMFAIRNGHSIVVKELLKRGCNLFMVNSNGQTAIDIADFWLNREISRILSTSVPRTVTPQQGINHFCYSPINRASFRRTDSLWLENALKHPNSIFIMFSNLSPLVCLEDQDFLLPRESGNDVKYRLARLNFTKIKKLNIPLEHYIFLGVETNETSNYNATDVCPGWFSVETMLDISEIVKIVPEAIVLPARVGLMQLARPEAAIVAQARSLHVWHNRNKFCPTCGHPSIMVDAGYRRKCLNKDCISNHGTFNTCYPRTDPSVIIAVSSSSNECILLGQNKLRHSKDMWSVLAGFVEPGESIEEACRREVYEETKVQVGAVRYHSSQPWPMPNSLMIGCHGQALSDFIEADKTEISRARWFDKPEIKQMLLCQHPGGFTLPPAQAIAHQLIVHWFKSSAFN